MKAKAKNKNFKKVRNSDIEFAMYFRHKPTEKG